eukprot:Clim_evm26s195 gene=Clim_evmTU26s195
MGNLCGKKDPIDFDAPANLSQFKILRSIGKGAFGKVAIVEHRLTKKEYAVKYMNKDLIVQKKAVKNVYHERKILERLSSPFVVNLWYAFQDAEDFYMIMDLKMGGDLAFSMTQTGPFTEDRLRFYAVELACGLQYLQSRCIVHRDIKPDNILMDATGHVAIADFNVAEYLPKGTTLKGRTGTRPYMAPEVLQRSPYAFAVDWWSLGMTLLELALGRHPFQSMRDSDAESIVCNGTVDVSCASTLSPECKDFLKGLLKRDAVKRLHLRAKGAHGSVNTSIERLDEIGTVREPMPAVMEQNAATIADCCLSGVAGVSVPDGTANSDFLNHPWFCEHPVGAAIDWDLAQSGDLPPPYVPPKDQMNCDATYELEEMMLEDNPIHLKKCSNGSLDHLWQDPKRDPLLIKMERKFEVYDRIQESQKTLGLRASKSLRRKPTQLSRSASVKPDLPKKEEVNKAVNSTNLVLPLDAELAKSGSICFEIHRVNGSTHSLPAPGTKGAPVAVTHSGGAVSVTPSDVTIPSVSSSPAEGTELANPNRSAPHITVT